MERSAHADFLVLLNSVAHRVSELYPSARRVGVAWSVAGTDEGCGEDWAVYLNGPALVIGRGLAELHEAAEDLKQERGGIYGEETQRIANSRRVPNPWEV